jgi:YesN/AraC family two-component response regulator
VADDETLARGELAYMLRRLGGIEIVDQAASAVEALVARLQETQYDVLFMDIRMPGLSGLEAMEVVSRLPRPPRVVFVSAYDEHALAAFKVAAIDYLVKPVSEPRLRQAVDRVVGHGHRPGARIGTLTAKLAVEHDNHMIPASQTSGFCQQAGTACLSARSTPRIAPASHWPSWRSSSRRMVSCAYIAPSW